MFLHAHDQESLPQYYTELVTGKDIMNILDISPGKKVGDIKNALHEEQVLGRITTKNEAEAFVRNFFSESSSSESSKIST